MPQWRCSWLYQRTNSATQIHAAATSAKGFSGISGRYFNVPKSDSLNGFFTNVEARGDARALALIKQISPVAWRHILLNGHHTFHSDGKVIDLDAIVAGIDLG